MKKWLHESRVGGWFGMVEVEINSHCNRRCRYCPNSTLTRDSSLPDIMSDEIFERLLSKLARVGYGGRMSFHFYGEPLLHPGLLDLVRQVTAELPAVRQVLYTNGDMLTDALHEELSRSGIKRFIVTSHDGCEITARSNQVILFPSDLVLTNRGGTVEFGQPVKVSRPLSAPCYAPSSVLIVTVTGEVLLCYEDARRSIQMGNIKDQPIEDIWFSERFQQIRMLLADGDRRATSVCKVCNNLSHPNADTYDYRP